MTDVPGEPGLFYLDERGRLRDEYSPETLRRLLRGDGGRLWVDLDSRSDAQFRLLSELFHFHPLAIEDTRSPDCRVKLEEYDDYLFIVIRGIRFALETAEPYDIDTLNLYLFLGARYLVTVHAGHSRSIKAVADRVRVAPDFFARGVDYLAYMVTDTLVDNYFPILDQVDLFVDELEDEIFQGGDGTKMSQIIDLKRSLLALRRHQAPMREVAASLANRPSPYLRPETQLYFRDVYDHVVRQLESVETYRELVTSAMEANLAVISNRVNEIIKTLSVIATIVLPPTLVASVYGMNFRLIPGADDPYGFWIAVLIMGAISAGFLLYLWRKDWL